jgi:hypothetical protein
MRGGEVEVGWERDEEEGRERGGGREKSGEYRGRRGRGEK